jgi:thioredoxin 1
MADAVTEQTFDTEVLGSDQPVLVYFWADWCGPCHAIAPVLDQIAAERGDLKVVKLNIDEEPGISQRYGVMSIPTLILFKGGEPVAAAVGAMPKSMLEQRLGLSEAAA